MFVKSFFFYQAFLSRTLTIHRTAGEGTGSSITPLYHFHHFTNIHILFATVYVRWLPHIFNHIACVYQATANIQTFICIFACEMTLTYWWCDVNFCLFAWWFHSTISFIIFWDFSMFYQIFLSPQVKRWAIIIYKHGIYQLPNDIRLLHHKRNKYNPPFRIFSAKATKFKVFCGLGHTQ